MKLYSLVDIHVYYDDNDYYAWPWIYRSREEAVQSIARDVMERIDNLQEDDCRYWVEHNTEEWDVVLKTDTSFHGWRIEEQDLEV